MIHLPELDHIVERQVSLWDAIRKLAPEGDRTKQAEKAGGPWVTISMQLGSGGIELAERLGKRLGWQVFNKEILQAIAGKMHAREKVLSRLDEHAVGALQDYLAHLFVHDHPGRPAYLVEMMSVLWAIARQGQAVIVGRGANWLLDPAGGVRVRVVAPMEQRVAWVARRESISPAEAQRRIHENDVDRAAFIRQAFRRNIDEALGYDLTVNTGSLEMGPAVEAVAAALSHKIHSPVNR